MNDPFEYIRDAYKVPARKGARIRFKLFHNRKAMPGAIVGVRGPYLLIVLDGCPLRRYMVHPTWKMEYIEEEGGES